MITGHVRKERDRRLEARRKPAEPQAVLTDSVLLVNLSRPLPMQDFLQPRTQSLSFGDVRDCYFNDTGGVREVRCLADRRDGAEPLH